jgi:hypothetical protein
LVGERSATSADGVVRKSRRILSWRERMALPSPVFSPRKARHEIASRVVPLEDVEPPLMAGEQVAAETGPSEVLGSAHIDALAEDRYLIQIVHFEAPLANIVVKPRASGWGMGTTAFLPPRGEPLEPAMADGATPRRAGGNVSNLWIGGNGTSVTPLHA